MPYILFVMITATGSSGIGFTNIEMPSETACKMAAQEVHKIAVDSYYEKVRTLCIPRGK